MALMKPFNYKIIYEYKGLVMLPTIIILSLVVLAIGASMTISGFIESLMSKATIETQESFYLADSGIEDALLRIAYPDDFFTSSGDWFLFESEVNPGPSINVSGTGDTRTIISSVTDGKYKKTIETTVTLDEESGGITGIIWEEK